MGHLDGRNALFCSYLVNFTYGTVQHMTVKSRVQAVSSIMLADYPQAVAAWNNPQLEADYEYLQCIITKVGAMSFAGRVYAWLCSWGGVLEAWFVGLGVVL